MNANGRLQTPATPEYVTTPAGQLRLWSVATGRSRPLVVALAGLTRSAQQLAQDLAGAFDQTGVIVVELPGVGGSAQIDPDSLAASVDVLAQGLSFLAGGHFALVAEEHACALLSGLADRLSPVATAGLAAADAAAWARLGPSPPTPDARDDGTHLLALWAFLRDRRILTPQDRRYPRPLGEPLPTPQQLSAAFVDAIKDPERFVRMWELCGEALAGSDLPLPQVAEISGLAATLGELPASGVAGLPPTEPGPGLWHQYLGTAVGRAHLRRAGAGGPPILILPTGGGSCAQFAPVVEAFGAERTAVAVDYFGNGLSDPLERRASIEILAGEAFAVADALGWETFDVWGSHTGASVALEMSIQQPERIERLVLEAPAFVSPEFGADLLANYFPDFAPDTFGRHLIHVWNWRRDMFMYWPWYRNDAEHRRDIGVPSAADLHLYAIGILESSTTYDGAYRTAFAYDPSVRLPHLSRPALLTAGPFDMLSNALTDAASLAPDGLLEIAQTPATVWWPDPDPEGAVETIATYKAFLDGRAA